ncbi:MAG: cation transporter [Oscillospiraceae bacterium]|nr:cation transporter [Oscillospiraceae bacterium]
MTKLLLRLFIKEDPQTPKGRSAVGKLSGFVGIFCNFVLFILKLTVGTLVGSLSMTADAMNNLTDATSSVVTLVGFRLAEKPADEDHPYGHARYEYLSGLAVAALIVVIGFELGKGSVEKILSPTPVSMTLPAVLVLVGSVLLKLWLSLFNRKLGKTISSQTLLATAADSRNDMIATSAVLLAMAVEKVSGWQVDGYMGLLVALFILYSGITLAKDTISPLLGENADPALQEDIVRIVESEPLVLGYHDLMVHDYGPGQRFASMHVEMDEQESALHCHEVIDNLERICLKELNVHLVIHYDPIVTGDAQLEYMRSLVLSCLKEQDERISIHDFRMVKGQGHTNLIFDIALPADLMSAQKKIKGFLDEKLNDLSEETCYTVVNFDLANFNN